MEKHHRKLRLCLLAVARGKGKEVSQEIHKLECSVITRTWCQWLLEEKT